MLLGMPGSSSQVSFVLVAPYFPRLAPVVPFSGQRRLRRERSYLVRLEAAPRAPAIFDSAGSYRGVLLALGKSHAYTGCRRFGTLIAFHGRRVAWRIPPR